MHKRSTSQRGFTCLFGQIFILLYFFSHFALADFGQDTFSDFSFPHMPGRKSGSRPVVTLDLDPQNILDSSMRISAREGRLADLETLLQKGADIDSRSGTGATALMLSARNCSVRVTDFLLKHGAEVNMRDFEGRTALIHAASGSCLRVAELLLRVPAIEYDARDRNGKNALDYAEENAVTEVDGPADGIIRKIALIKRKRPFRISGNVGNVGNVKNNLLTHS